MSKRSFLKLYNDLLLQGEEIEIGGNSCLELNNYEVCIPDPRDCLTSFEARKLNLDYCKAEWLWYLNAHRFDTEIEEHATMWKKLRQEDGGYNSNYGVYIFGQYQFEWVIKSLVKDTSSRQACMQLLNTSHMYDENTDVVCTMGIQFLIRHGHLNMYVNMRSNDAIYGFTNDVFCFAQLHQMVYWKLREKGVKVKLGQYFHRAGSMHVYERHFEMLKQLVVDGFTGYKRIHIPEPKDFEDFKWLMFRGPGNGSNYANWMLGEENDNESQ